MKTQNKKQIKEMNSVVRKHKDLVESILVFIANNTKVKVSFMNTDNELFKNADTSDFKVVKDFNKYFCDYSDDKIYRRYNDKELSDSVLDEIVDYLSDKDATSTQKDFNEEFIKDRNLILSSRELLRETLSFQYMNYESLLKASRQ